MGGTVNSIQQLQQLGQSVWLDYIRRGLIKSGELKQLVELGITGLTANPTILEKAIIGSTDYDDELIVLARAGKSNEEIYETMVIEDICRAADMMRPTYDRSGGADGYPCLEISPLVAYDTDGTVKEGRRLFAALSRSNVMVKVPATPQGIPAIRQLTGEGINVNVTLIFSLDAYEQVKEAYIAGLEDLVRKGGDPSKVTSVASFFLSRIDTLVDGKLADGVKKGDERSKLLLGKTAIASAKVAYSKYKDTFNSARFGTLKDRKAHAQRLLWASTGTKNPAYRDVMYIEPIIGTDTVNTMPLDTMHAFLDHGKAEITIEQGVREAEQMLKDLASVGINLKEVTDKLLADGVAIFADSFRKMMTGIQEKKSKLVTTEPAPVETNLGRYDTGVKTTLNKLTENDSIRRIWHKDHTVWKTDPTEITNRLGWLTVTDLMHEQVPMLQSFAREVRDANFRHIVLLGMGGSSLGSEVLRQVFGSASGFPQLLVLDSTIPESIKAVAKAINPAQTLFLVSSKSGTTTEPVILYRYFRNLVKGKEAGQNFAAITDAGTPLARLAEKEKFRRAFINPADIGGRYSVLSYFGLLPAALLGIDIKSLLERADGMREGCASCVPVPHNPGAWLGAFLATLTLEDRDKLTLITSPSLSSFGLWVEQLIAESTGKEGKGIIPVVGEPVAQPDDYGSDRFFVYLRLKDDNNSVTDAAINALKASGQPVVVLDMKDKYDLGAEFFRWEFAVAVAGALLGINPFDQPDVQRAKDATESLLRDYKQYGRLPPVQTPESLTDLLLNATAGKYLAIMAYMHQTPALDEVLAALRSKIMTKYHIATTLCYGPRFLHSTGQLHKGGADKGLFLQITISHQDDLTIPGEPYTFGTVADAQALGDLRALQAVGRQVCSVRLVQGDVVSVKKLVDEIA